MADAVVAPGEIVGAISHAPDDLPERKRDHDEAEAGRAQRQHAEERRGRGRERDREHRRGELIVARGGGEDAGIAGNAEIGGMPERDHAAVAEHHVDGEREQRVNEHLARHVDVELVADNPRHRGERQHARR